MTKVCEIIGLILIFAGLFFGLMIPWARILWVVFTKDVPEELSFKSIYFGIFLMAVGLLITWEAMLRYEFEVFEKLEEISKALDATMISLKENN